MKIKFESHPKNSTANTASKLGHVSMNIGTSKERNVTRYLARDNADEAMNLNPVQTNSNLTQQIAIDFQKRDGMIYANLVRFR
jgi:hypothetical protein